MTDPYIRRYGYLRHSRSVARSRQPLKWWALAGVVLLGEAVAALILVLALHSCFAW